MYFIDPNLGNSTVAAQKQYKNKLYNSYKRTSINVYNKQSYVFMKIIHIDAETSFPIEFFSKVQFAPAAAGPARAQALFLHCSVSVQGQLRTACIVMGEPLGFLSFPRQQQRRP